MKRLDACLKHGAASEPFTVSDSGFVYVLNTQHAPGPVLVLTHAVGYFKSLEVVQLQSF